MTPELTLLVITAATLGFTHTIFGPDHYLPFIVIAKAKKWSHWKTIRFTLLCGLGHIGSSVALGFIGIFFGLALAKLQLVEGVRGDFAGWLLFAFGLAYFVWGVRQSLKNRPHTHYHYHSAGDVHLHEHVHFDEHAHVHEEKEKKLTPWVLFLIFVFGPCEVLIPLVMYPAAQASLSGMLLVVGTFSAATIGTMLTIVTLGTYGLSFARFGFLEKHTEAVAGFSILLCGAAIVFLGL